jgi:hypothetical protein
VRQTTKAIVSIASLGLIAASYKFGLDAPAAFANAEALAQAQNPNQATGQPNAAPNTPTDPGTTPAAPKTPTKPGTPNKPVAKPTQPAKPNSSSSSSNSGASGNTNSGSSGAGSGSSGSGSTGSNTSSGSSGSGSNSNTGGSTTTPTEVTKTGTSIRYRFGTVQVSVTKTDGKITAVNLLQAGATGGRGQAFDFLVQYTIDAQGSSFGNISGATYTTDAYKQSLNAALAQF